MKLLDNSYYSVLTFFHIDRIHVGISIDANPSLLVDKNTHEVTERDQVCIKLEIVAITVMFFIYI
jgi:hypothetical protein